MVLSGNKRAFKLYHKFTAHYNENNTKQTNSKQGNHLRYVIVFNWKCFHRLDVRM